MDQWLPGAGAQLPHVAPCAGDFQSLIQAARGASECSHWLCCLKVGAPGSQLALNPGFQRVYGPAVLPSCACCHSSSKQILAPCLQVQKAVEDGYDVRGFMYWTLVDK